MRKTIHWTGRWAYKAVKRGPVWRAMIANRNATYSPRNYKWRLVGIPCATEAKALAMGKMWADDKHAIDTPPSARVA